MQIQNPTWYVMRIAATAIVCALLLCFGPLSDAAAQEVTVLPDTVDFGFVKPGALIRGKAKLLNGKDDEVVVRLKAAGNGFAVDPDTLRVAPGSSASFGISFISSTAGPHHGQVLFEESRLFGSARRAPLGLSATVSLPTLQIDPGPAQSLRFGEVDVGREVLRTIVLRNRGDVAVNIDSVHVRGDGFMLPTALALELAPAEQASFNVSFRPAKGGRFDGRFIVASRDVVADQAQLVLIGDGLAPRARVSPLPEVGVNFGLHEIGQQAAREVTILNQGRADLQITAITASGRGFSAVTLETPLIILPDDRHAVVVDFAPTYEGPAPGSLTIDTNDPDRPRVEVPLLGEGQVSPPRVQILNNSTIPFGDVPIGKTVTEYVLLWNGGGSPITVQLTLGTEGAGPEFNLETSQYLLQPGASGKVGLTFSPKEIGLREEQLWVETEKGRQKYQLVGKSKYLKLTPSTKDFERVAVGESRSAVLEVFNIGNADFTVTNVTSNNQDFAVYSQVTPQNEFLLPGNSLRTLPLSITFSPSARGLSTSILRLDGFWDEGLESLDVLASGTGVAAEIELHPSGPIEFDYVVLGESQVRTIIATNTGDTSLEVTGNPYTKEVGIAPASFSLQPGESTKVDISFAPQALGDRFGKILLVSNDVRDKAQPIQVLGKGALEGIDLPSITSVIGTRKESVAIPVRWTSTPIVVRDDTKLDLAFQVPDSLANALVGRKFDIEWVQLDDKYDPIGSAKQTTMQVYNDERDTLYAENLNLRLQEDSIKRVRVKITTRSYPGASPQSVSQVFEAGGWKWEFEAKPLVSFLTIRPGRDYTDAAGNHVEGVAERLIGLPGIAFAGYHNSENPSVSGVHLTAIGNVLEALSTENSIAVSVGLALSLYKDRFLFGFGWDVYDSRPDVKKKATQDYIMTFKFSALF